MALRPLMGGSTFNPIPKQDSYLYLCPNPKALCVSEGARYRPITEPHSYRLQLEIHLWSRVYPEELSPSQPLTLLATVRSCRISQSRSLATIQTAPRSARPFQEVVSPSTPFTSVLSSRI